MSRMLDVWNLSGPFSMNYGSYKSIISLASLYDDTYLFLEFLFLFFEYSHSPWACLVSDIFLLPKNVQGSRGRCEFSLTNRIKQNQRMPESRKSEIPALDRI